MGLDIVFAKRRAVRLDVVLTQRSAVSLDVVLTQRSAMSLDVVLAQWGPVALDVLGRGRRCLLVLHNSSFQSPGPGDRALKTAQLDRIFPDFRKNANTFTIA